MFSAIRKYDKGFGLKCAGQYSIGPWRWGGLSLRPLLTFKRKEKDHLYTLEVKRVDYQTVRNTPPPNCDESFQIRHVYSTSCATATC